MCTPAQSIVRHLNGRRSLCSITLTSSAGGAPAPQRTLTASLRSGMRQPAVDVAVRGSEQSGLPEPVPVYEPL